MFSSALAVLSAVALLPVQEQDSTHAQPMRDAAMKWHATGTSWVPASTPMDGIRVPVGNWSFMTHGYVNLNYASDPDPRGDQDVFSTNMIMGRLGGTLGPGHFEARLMLSGEPAMGAAGYPLLLQTGETADGIAPLRDRQHPHDLLMEVGALYRANVAEGFTLFGYVAPVGEPALGPTAFVARRSSRDNPIAPIGHHFLDATHISYGVVTAGLVANQDVKLEVSLFNGREPDEKRWEPDKIRLNSVTARVTVNPHRDWSMQASLAEQSSPEQVHPGIDVQKLTLSVTYNRPIGTGNWQTTAAFGRSKNQRTVIPVSEARATFSPPVLEHYLSGQDLSGLPEDSLFLVFPSRVQRALLLESSLQWKIHSTFVRAEYAEKDELFDPSDVRHSAVYRVGKVTLGYSLDIPIGSFRYGIGIAGTLNVIPRDLRSEYGATPVGAVAFMKLRL